MLRLATFTLAVGILVAPLAAHAQPSRKVPQIGYLSSGSSDSAQLSLDAFRQGLRELGWVEGQNIAIEYRWAGGRAERLSDLAADLVRLKTDVIVTTTTPAALAAKQATSAIPIIMAISAYPVESGVVATLAWPGGNITGVSATPGVEIVAKRLEMLKEAAPKVSRVAVLCDFSIEPEVATFKIMLAAARALRLTLLPLDVGSPKGFEDVFPLVARERADAIFVFLNDTNLGQRRRIADFAAKRRLPTIFEERSFVEAGGLMAYGANAFDMFRRAASYVDKVLKGSRPGGLPVEQPTRFELVINLKTAKALGLTMPPSVLIRADQVIE